MASPLTSLEAYWRFQRAVVTAQVAAWMPTGRQLLIDLSGPRAGTAAQAAVAGHTVLRVWPNLNAVPPRWPATQDPARRAGTQATPGRVAGIVADSADLAFLADGCADGVIADDGTLSRHLVAEDVAREIARVLRPGGKVLACVDSLVLGMAVLAEQHHWARLTDLPAAEVVLIPWPDGTITRCFGAAQLRDLLTDAGLEVSWIRPRTVLSPSTVDHVLQQDPEAIPRLVRAELEAEADESATNAEAFGIHLLAAAHKPAPP